MDSAALVSAVDKNLGGMLTPDGLADELNRQGAFALFDEKVQHHSHSGISVTLRSLAVWLIDRSLAVGSKQAVADLGRYLATDLIPYRQFVILGGVAPVGELHLGGGVVVRQVERLPQSTWKEQLLAQYRSAGATCRPTVFLEKKTLFPREHLPRGERSRHVYPDPPQELADVPLLITALGPFAPLILGSWDEAEDWMPDLHRGGYASLLDPAWLGEHPQTAADIGPLPNLHREWLNRSEDCRRHLRVALTRLNSAKRHVDVVEAAIDFGIAMEALFLADRGPDRGELGFTLRLRAARFLGTTPESRRDITKLFRELYDLRSKAVHTGRLHRPVKDYHKIQELLAQGFAHVATAIRRIIKEGEPDWEAVVLG